MYKRQVFHRLLGQSALLPILARLAVAVQGLGWNVPSNTFLLCQIGSSSVLLKSTRGNSLVIPPRPLLALIPPLLAGYAVKGRSLRSLSLRSPWTAPAFAAPLRCDGGSGGNDNIKGFFKFGQDDKAFGKWRQGRLPFLKGGSSLRFMQVYEKFSSLPQFGVTDLIPSVLYELAAPSTPESAVVEIISRAQVK